MIPLWTTATSSREKCGCALVVTGAPCVAQRVCEMPSSPASPDFFNWASRSATRAVLRERVSAPPASSATPQES